MRSRVPSQLKRDQGETAPDSLRKADGRRFGVRRLISDERGVALTEFALVAPILMVLLFGMVDLGKAFNYWIDETHLANRAARLAAVDKNPGDAVGWSLQKYVRCEADTEELREGGPSVTRLDVNVSFDGTNVGGSVTVEVSTDYSFLAILGLPAKRITGKATMRIEQLPSEYAANPAPNEVADGDSACS
jgi:Flp pilus assembly protein TadG